VPSCLIKKIPFWTLKNTAPSFVCLVYFVGKKYTVLEIRVHSLDSWLKKILFWRTVLALRHSTVPCSSVLRFPCSAVKNNRTKPQRIGVYSNIRKEEKVGVLFSFKMGGEGIGEAVHKGH